VALWAFDALGDTLSETEPQAKGEAPAGLVVGTSLVERHEVLLGRRRRLDRHESRKLVRVKGCGETPGAARG
jgi:hypothetical protein